jgi:hypothetical protein
LYGRGTAAAIRGAFYRFQAQPQQLEKSTMLETVWIDKDPFQFSAVA